MKTIDQIYINGGLKKHHGKERFDLINPSTGRIRGYVLLGDEIDAREAIAAAKAAFPSFSRTTREERATYLSRIREALAARKEELIAAMLEEYGASRAFVETAVQLAINNPLEVCKT